MRNVNSTIHAILDILSSNVALATLLSKSTCQREGTSYDWMFDSGIGAKVESHGAITITAGEYSIRYGGGNSVTFSTTDGPTNSNSTAISNSNEADFVELIKSLNRRYADITQNEPAMQILDVISKSKKLMAYLKDECT